MGDMFPIMGSPRNWLDASSLPESLNLSEFVGGRSERTRDSVGLEAAAEAIHFVLRINGGRVADYRVVLRTSFKYETYG